MTQPPSQPDPYGQPGNQPYQGGYPQQPGTYGQPGQYPPAPGQYPQPGAQPQPGQYPAGGQYGQPQPGAPGQYGDPNQFPQSGPLPQQGGYPQQPQQPYGQPQPGYPPQQAFDPYGNPIPPPRPRNNKLPLLLGGGGLVVIGIVVTLVLVLSGGTGTPKGTADAFVSAMKGTDVDDFTKLLCDDNTSMRPSQKDLEKTGGKMPTMGVEFTVGDVKETGDTATADINASIGGQQGTAVLKMKKVGGDWCVSDLDFDFR
ncbi:DUF4878 domain-containing protein [Actinokineospora enzanensis]|uniref:Rv0361 family membrane protein n=1 Tax=Actinokineospora enzanensis TaxID=155975 RepID=UPI00036FB7B5|nr:DUF4878 domain-containing protein [Actinokineospora enzanensis]